MDNTRTKASIVNTPNNSVGKIFTQKQLEFIGQLCIYACNWEVLCIMYKVYQRIVYETNRHFQMSMFSVFINKIRKEFNLYIFSYM